MDPQASVQALLADQDLRFVPPALLQYWHTMLRWRSVLLAIIGASLVTGVILTLLTAPLYTSKSEIEISRQQKRVTNVAGVDAQEGPQDLEFYATQYNLLKSISQAERVAKSLRLVDDPAFYAAFGKALPAPGPERQKLAVDLLLKNVSIDPIRTSRLVDVSFTCRQAALAARITDAWDREFIGATTDREYESSGEARAFLESRLDALRLKMEVSEQNAVAYAARNNIIVLETSRDPDGKTQTQRTLTSADLEQLDTALLVARADRIAAQARAQSGKADVSADVLANASIGAIKQKRAEIGAEYARLLIQFEPQYPAARALKEELDALDTAIARDTARFGEERSQNWQQALAREHDLERQVAATRALLEKQNHATIQYNIFQRDADTNRQLYDGMLQRYKEIAEAGSVGASNIAIVDPADLPDKPSSPRLLVNLALALLGGIALSAAAVFVLDQIDEGIRSPTDVWTLLKLPLLGNVPRAPGAPQEALANPKSMVSEAYLTVRSNLAFSTNHGMPRSLAFTSAQPAEGKSTSAFALADIIARTGRKVVLVDADLRAPSLHTVLGVANAHGLSNVLAGDGDVFAHVQDPGARAMAVMLAGPLPPNPAELLSSDVFARVVATLLERYDHVIVDSPPVLGLADAPLICRAVEGCVFVAEPGRSPLRAIRTAVLRLKFIGAHTFGLIITKIDLGRHHYGHAYGYGDSYGDRA
jgi:capsular exopolysaccharide synthesis family protein